MQVKSINSQHPEKNIQGPKIIKLKSDKFAEAPLIRKLKDALLSKTQEKYPAIRDFLTCAASHRAPEQSTLDALSAIRDEVVSYIESMVEHRRSMSQSSKTQLREALDLEFIISMKSGCISRVKNLSFEVVSDEKKEASGSRLRLPKNLNLNLNA